ncbi:hypothetical protein [Streptacidiphilus anmyonensis]|uniref:hypothetical protein n=1 Tax=Streptacidiphilus anmyonensis TaxID=405782 RepID=UPI0005A79A98|nr:hypothetical protein [Streptacidiphilus anmyonensis]
MTDPTTDPTRETTGPIEATEATADGVTSSAPVPLLQMLQLPGLPGAEGGDVPVCGPDGCAVPVPADKAPQDDQP